MKSKPAMLIFISFLMGLSTARAEPLVLLQANDLSNEEFKAVLEANPEYQSFTDYWPKRIEVHPMTEELKHSFLHAQQTFLQSEIASMKPEWEKVFSFAYKNDWAMNYREMIQTAGLRVAQLSTSPAETDEWLTYVAQFDENLQPNKSLFPPPLLQRYEKIRHHLPRMTFSFRSDIGFEKVLINGSAHRIVFGRPLTLPQTTVRATFVSSKYLPVTRVLPVHELKLFKPAQQILVGGDCEAPALNLSQGLSVNMNDLGMVYSRKCITPVRRAQTQDSAISLPNKNFFASNPSSTGIENTYSLNAQDKMAKPAFYKRPWFWVGAVAIAGAIAYSVQQRDNSTSSPTHTEGF